MSSTRFRVGPVPKTDQLMMQEQEPNGKYLLASKAQDLVPTKLKDEFFPTSNLNRKVQNA
jgi:hypothetical protein